MSKSNGAGRTRNFATVVYPESAPDNWKDILIEHHVPAFISPLHDNDLNPTGEKKKEHFHVMIMFDGVKTVEQACEIFVSIGGVGCEVVKTIRGYARYLCHLDNPDKAQYCIDDVTSLCGADYFGTCSLTIDKYYAIREMMDFCKRECIYSYSELMDYASVNRMDWFRSLCDNSSYVMREYMKSLAWSTKQDYYEDSKDEDNR